MHPVSAASPGLIPVTLKFWGGALEAGQRRLHVQVGGVCVLWLFLLRDFKL